jgi:alkylation response protein AidB-like acyl-CoA dehydrogenase
MRADEPVRYDVRPALMPSPLESGYLSVVELAGGFEKVALAAPGVIARARLACAAEMLGACETMLDDAVGYCGTREQFGSPIAGFQAVAHALAWAATEISQLRALLSVSLAGEAIGSPVPMLAMATKALAGQTARRVAQSTLQVTGGMGFTWEYPHNRFHRRTLVLDALAGSAEQLYLDLGARLRRGIEIDGSYPALIPLETFATSG